MIRKDRFRLVEQDRPEFIRVANGLPEITNDRFTVWVSGMLCSDSPWCFLTVGKFGDGSDRHPAGTRLSTRGYIFDPYWTDRNK